MIHGPLKEYFLEPTNIILVLSVHNLIRAENFQGERTCHLQREPIPVGLYWLRRNTGTVSVIKGVVLGVRDMEN